MAVGSGATIPPSQAWQLGVVLEGRAECLARAHNADRGACLTSTLRLFLSSRQLQLLQQEIVDETDQCELQEGGVEVGCLPWTGGASPCMMSQRAPAGFCDVLCAAGRHTWYSCVVEACCVCPVCRRRGQPADGARGAAGAYAHHGFSVASKLNCTCAQCGCCSFKCCLANPCVSSIVPVALCLC